ncbi:MAG: LLM class flavin-dependent oxidoreductase, partial [Phycisphaerae bacterium]|nr:LLM class flavin-dependent oxidoreductase [Phycisphaerae bacterium]
MSIRRISVLDQSPVPENVDGGQALRNSIDLARLVDSLGYHRYWVAEHHGSPGLACTAPEVLIGPIASATQRIRVGSGGVMLPHYSPLKVAENFSMLAGMYPDRIDLAIGRAAGTDQNTRFALQRDRRQMAPDDFREQLDELLGYFQPNHSTRRPFAARTIMPGRPHRPQPWLLGSSMQSAIWAAEVGLPYAFADFIYPDGAEMAAHYRQHFTPNEQLDHPTLVVAMWAICADDEQTAIELSSSFRMMMTLMMRGQLIAVPSPQKAMEFLQSDNGGALPMQR